VSGVWGVETRSSELLLSSFRSRSQSQPSIASGGGLLAAEKPINASRKSTLVHQRRRGSWMLRCSRDYRSAFTASPSTDNNGVWMMLLVPRPRYHSRVAPVPHPLDVIRCPIDVAWQYRQLIHVLGLLSTFRSFLWRCQGQESRGYRCGLDVPLWTWFQVSRSCMMFLEDHRTTSQHLEVVRVGAFDT
jgi:hypothetical protein